MTTVTSKRNGMFIVELNSPIGEVNELVIRPVSFDVADRWGSNSIQSTLGLLSVLTGVPESELRKLEYPDVDRVLTVMAIAVPAAIQNDISSGTRPLTTPKAMPAPVNAEDARPGDKIDPRFPEGDGPVRRWSGGRPVPDAEDTSGFSTSPPAKIEKVE